MQAETYYNHFNMQKLYGGGGYGGTEKGNRDVKVSSIDKMEDFIQFIGSHVEAGAC